jgi:hypothetical protein
MPHVPFFAVTLALMALIGVRLAALSERTRTVGFTLIAASCALICATFLYAATAPQ